MDDDIRKQAGLPSNWEVVDSPPIRPGQVPTAPPPPNAMDTYFQGSLTPTIQHDTYFVGTQYGTPGIPSHPLMLVGSAGNATLNSAINGFDVYA